MPQAALVIGSVLSVAGTVYSAAQQRRSARLQSTQQTIATRRSRRAAIRRAQLARAQSLATAQGSGTINSSGVSGGVGSLSSQLGADMGYSSQMSGLSRGIAQAGQRAQLGQVVSGFGNQVSGFGTARGASYQGMLQNILPSDFGATT